VIDLKSKDVAEKPEDAVETSPVDAQGTIGPSPEAYPLEPTTNIGGPATPPPIAPEDNVEPPPV
jgi:hypothetical protein